MLPQPRFSNQVSTRFYRPELDVLRFAAFSCVFFFHTLPQNPAVYGSAWVAATVRSWGYGIDLFLLLSSFLITELLLRELESRGRLDIWSFYMRRTLRIWPLYFAFLALALIVVPLVLPNDHVSRAHVLGFLTFTGNWTTAIFGYPKSVIAPLWSVGLEEQFYLAWPLLIVLVGRPGILRLCVSLVAVACLARIATMNVPHPAIWTSTLTRLDPIALGAVIAVTLRGKAPKISSAVRVALIATGLFIWAFCSRYLGYAGPEGLLAYPLVAIASALMLIAALRDSRFRGGGVVAVVVYLGRISYGLYVFHMLAHGLVAVYGTEMGLAASVLVALILTIFMAVVSYHALELPFLRMKRRFTHVQSRDYNQ